MLTGQRGVCGGKIVLCLLIKALFRLEISTGLTFSATKLAPNVSKNAVAIMLLKHSHLIAIE